MPAKFYDPDQIVLYLAGIRIQGFADGSFVAYERMSPGFQDVVGSDGEVARSKSNDKRAKVTIKLLQTAASNLSLSALHTTDLNATNGAGVGTFLLQDMQGNTRIAGPQAWIVKFPDGDMDRSAKSREWEIHIAEVVQVEGGN